MNVRLPDKCEGRMRAGYILLQWRETQVIMEMDRAFS